MRRPGRGLQKIALGQHLVSAQSLADVLGQKRVFSARFGRWSLTGGGRSGMIARSWAVKQALLAG